MKYFTFFDILVQIFFMGFNGIIAIFIIFFKRLKINNEIFEKILLSVSKYISIPIIMPKNIYIRISPSLKYHILYIISVPVNNQKTISSIYVMILDVLKLFLNALNISNNAPMSIPVIENIRNKYA